MKKAAYFALILVCPSVAMAQSGTNLGNIDSSAPPSNAMIEPGTNAPAAGDLAGTVSKTGSKDYTRLEALRPKGWDTPFPQIADTIAQDAGGVRSALADAGIGILGLSANTGVYNLRHDDTAGATYNGRRPTYEVGIQTLFLSFDTGKIGLNGGQFLVTAASITNGLRPIDGPRFTRITNLAYYQSLANGHVEVKVGYIDNLQEYVGTAVAGSLAAGNLGPQAQIPVQLGFGYNGVGAPAINVRLNADNGMYTKFGAQRSLPPGGANAEVPLNGGLGLRFSLPGTRALFVDEVGVRKDSAEGQRSLWFRAGVIYNTTRFENYKTGRTSENYALYAAVDRQLTQSDGAKPFRGIYVGGSFNYAPADRNLYSQYYEARVYGIGLLKSRPFDLASIVASYNKLSDAALASIVPNQRYQNYVTSIVASYAYRIFHGIYLQPGLGLVKNPTYAPKVPLAVNGYLSLSLLF